MLAEAERQLVKRLRAGEAPRSLVERFRHAHLAREAPIRLALLQAHVARTECLRGHSCENQQFQLLRITLS